MSGRICGRKMERDGSVGLAEMERRGGRVELAEVRGELNAVAWVLARLAANEVSAGVYWRLGLFGAAELRGWASCREVSSGGGLVTGLVGEGNFRGSESEGRLPGAELVMPVSD